MAPWRYSQAVIDVTEQHFHIFLTLTCLFAGLSQIAPPLNLLLGKQLQTDDVGEQDQHRAAVVLKAGTRA